MGKSVIETHPPPPRRLELLLLALYPLAWVALFAGSSIYWFLPAGLRLGTLWLLPRRAWWKMALLEWLAIAALSVARGAFETPPGLVASSVAPWCIYAVALRAIGRHGRGRPARDALSRLMGAGVVAAILTTIALTAIDLNDDGTLAASLPATLVSYALGDFAGIVIVVPLMLALRDQFGAQRVPWPTLFANGLVLAPVAFGLGLSMLPSLEAPVYPLVLSLFPVFGVAYRFGWRPSAIALALLTVAAHATAGPLPDLWAPGQLQLLIAVIGCAALLLGVASETQQQQRSTLSATVQALSMRGTQLVEAANRIASLQEQERRRIGAELHDQLGQDMTAIATRLRVVEHTAVHPDVRDGLASIRSLVNDAHAHLREVINSLHPAVLDRFGLSRALAEGPFAEMLDDHGIHYSCEIDGDVDALPDNIASALYRICQEATTNCAKHGCGGRVYIHLTLVPRVGGADLALHIGDYAGRLEIDPARPGRGLLNIRDRADAIGAHYAFNAESGVPRHALHVWVPQAAVVGTPG